MYDDDDIDDTDDFGDHVEPMMIHPHELPYDDEHVANEIQSANELRDGTTNQMTLLINYLKE